MTRDLRDILAEALWLEVGILRKPWAVQNELIPDECERLRLRADHLIRIMKTLIGPNEVAPMVPDAASSPVVWTYHIVGQQADRIVRKGKGDDWQILTSAGGKETLEHTFQLANTQLRADLVLTGDPEAKTIQSLGREFSAALTIYRSHAAGMGGAA